MLKCKKQVMGDGSMELILIRHGESQHNLGSSSSWDSPLSDRGAEQAAQAARALINLQLDLDMIYSSPMRRAVHTASLIGSHLNLRPRLWVDLAEHGLCWEETGISRTELSASYSNIDLTDRIDEEGWARHWTSETLEQLAERMSGAAGRLKEMAASEQVKAIACIIHGKSGNELLRHLLGIPDGRGVYFHHHNCGITRLILQPDGIVNLLAVNESNHLVGLVEPFLSNITMPAYR